MYLKSKVNILHGCTREKILMKISYAPMSAGKEKMSSLAKGNKA